MEITDKMLLEQLRSNYKHHLEAASYHINVASELLSHIITLEEKDKRRDK